MRRQQISRTAVKNDRLLSIENALYISDRLFSYLILMHFNRSLLP
jgi:hypothetical protein